MAIYCSKCGNSLPDGVAFCDTCGTPVRGQQGSGVVQSQSQAPVPASAPAGGMSGAGAVSCPACGAGAIPGEAFCDNCGAALLPNYSYAPMQTSPPAQAPIQAAQSPVQYSAPAAQRTASLIVTNPPPPATLPIPNLHELIVGRSDQQSNSYPDVDLGPYGGLDLGVSRRHFRLSRNGDQFYIEDLGSVNGTVVNGQRIVSHNLHPLSSGDIIALGKMEMTFELA